MTILRNAYFLGETVLWGDAPGEPAGTGRVDSIFESAVDELCYRIERTVTLPGRRYALLPESYVAGRA